MSDDWVNDPYDEAPVHVLDDEGEPDAEAEGGQDADASCGDVLTTDD